MIPKYYKQIARLSRQVNNKNRNRDRDRKISNKKQKISNNRNFMYMKINKIRQGRVRECQNR